MIILTKIYENYESILFHMTDLPYGRGGSPLQNLITNKIYNTKITAIKVSKELDEGDIYLKKILIFQREVPKRFMKMLQI